MAMVPSSSDSRELVSEFKADYTSAVNSKDVWYESVNVESLSDEAKRGILEAVKNKLGFTKACEVLDIAKSSLHRYLSGERKIPGDVVKRALRYLSKEEFESIVTEWDKLKALGIIKENGAVDYGLVLRILAHAARDEYLKNAILQFVVREFREDLRKMLGISFAGIKLEWSEDFEKFLIEWKKHKKVKDPETLKYYRNLFMKYLQGKELSEQLIDYVVNHKNKWLRNVFRHYIQYLYYRRRIPLETFGWIMEVVPSRSYSMAVKAYRIDLDLFGKTMEFLKQNYELYYLYYLLMYYSGIRLEHVVKLVESYSPEEEAYIEMLEDWSPRLVCFEDKGFCRYYMGLGRTEKPCEWVYFPVDLLPLLEKYRGARRDRSSVSDYAASHNLLRPKYLRKLNWRVLEAVIPNENVCKFIHSRFGELKMEITKAVYSDLLSSADLWYPDAMDALKKGLEDVEYLKKVLLSKSFRNNAEKASPLSLCKH